LSKDHPVFYCDFRIEKGASLGYVVKAVHNPEERRKWDKDVEMAEVI